MIIYYYLILDDEISIFDCLLYNKSFEHFTNYILYDCLFVFSVLCSSCLIVCKPNKAYLLIVLALSCCVNYVINVFMFLCLCEVAGFNIYGPLIHSEPELPSLVETEEQKGKQAFTIV